MQAAHLLFNGKYLCLGHLMRTIYIIKFFTKHKIKDSDMFMVIFNEIRVVNKKRYLGSC